MNLPSPIMKFVCSFLLTSILISCLLLTSCSPTRAVSNSNLEPKDSTDAATGGFVWGQNDKDTNMPQEETSNDVILERQREVLKRQEEERERLHREKQDILRQDHYNRQLQGLP